MGEVLIWDPLERLLYGVSIGILFITGMLFLSKVRKQEEKQGKRMMLGFGLFYLFFGFRNIFMFLSEFYYIGSFQDGMFFGQIDEYFPFREFYISFAHTFITLSFTSLLFALESYYKKSRYFFTIIEASFLIVIILAPFELEQILISPTTPSVAIIGTIIIYHMVKHSTLELKSIGFFFFNSFACIMIGIVSTYPDFKLMNIMPLYLGSLFFLLACVFMTVPFALNIEKLTKTMNYYLLSITIGGSACFLAIFIDVLSNFNLISKIFVLFTGVCIIFFYIRSYPILKSNMEHSSKGIDILKMFVRPNNITEDDVIISMEKKICLVCKGKVGRYNIYLCPKCDALYHQKCAKTLEGMDNACWYCNSPFDEFKPQKLIEEDRAEIIEIINEKVRKNDK